MNQSKTPKAARRYEQPFDSNLNIKRYDSDNLYPNNILLKVADSPTASGCLSRYIDFIEGNGIRSTALSACEMNRDGQTLDDIHALVSKDKATFDGFAILIQYDVFCCPCAIYHYPFEQCRLEEADDKGNINHIVVHPDWAGNATRGGNRVRVDAKSVKRINVFNPDPAVVAEQIAEAGGITNYLGQIYYHSGAGHLVYPKPKYDNAITDISTDTGVSNVMNRNARNNFLAAGVYTYFASSPNPDLEDQIDDLQGDMNAASIISISLQNAQEKPEFTEFKAHNFDKDFTATTAAMTERIYSAFGQEGWHCLRIGKIGFSGDLVGDIEKEYAKRCKKDQRAITKAYFAILSRFADGLLPEQPTLKALTIEPYSSIETQTATL